jgi:hypothetical protein
MTRAFGMFIPSTTKFGSISDVLQNEFGFRRIDSAPLNSELAISALVNDSFITLWLVRNPDDYIKDAIEWDWIEEATRSLLAGSQVVSAEYNQEGLARETLVAILNAVGVDAERLVIDNDFGVLLKGNDVKDCLLKEPTWSWRRESFPEIAGCPHVE